MATSKSSAAKKKGAPPPKIVKANLVGKTLVIVESPAKAKTINKYLGKDYVIEASMGHIIDLPRSRMAVDVENNFTPEYITVRGRASILNRLKRIATNVDRVLLAADPDREGEAISWHLSRALKPLNSDIKRIEFNEITESALKEAVKSPRDIDMNLVNAQQARRILDRLVGYNISPLLWKKIKRGLSAGRVQSVALRLVCDREKEIENFVPEEYWSLDVHLLHGKNTVEASLASIDGEKAELKNEESVNAILQDIEKGHFAVKGVTTKERKKSPTAPYTTSKLQQDAANKLGFTSHRAMMIAQQLYEGIELGNENITGLITYMRTDSTRISPQAVDHVREYIKNRSDLGERYLPPEPRTYRSSRSAQDAHEAIRPTDPSRDPASVASFLTKEQLKLYTMIWEKFVSCQMSDEISDHTSADIESGRYLFRASGRVVKFPGFTAILSQEEKKKKEKKTYLTTLKEGDELKLKSTHPEQHFTQPPPRYTDASMVKVLEESGVGRPSTYAPTIQTLLKRFYVSRVQKALKPTDLGRLVYETMNKHFANLVDLNFTARMEGELDLVSASNLNWVDMLKNFYDPFIGTVEHAREHMDEMRNILDEPTDQVCEKCGKPMVKKIGRNGYFLACSGFPDCKNARAIPLGPCPKCDTGHVIQRATKRGRPFFGCDRYPECDFSTWDKPTGGVCPVCGKILLEKSSREKGKYTGCSACDYEDSSQSA